MGLPFLPPFEPCCYVVAFAYSVQAGTYSIIFADCVSIAQTCVQFHKCLSLSYIYGSDLTLSTLPKVPLAGHSFPKEISTKDCCNGLG